MYLSEANTNKDVKEGSGKGLIFCKAEMQGWRKNMEDAAIHEVDLGDGNSLFGVFDGHGGTTYPMQVTRSASLSRKGISTSSPNWTNINPRTTRLP